jgi:hypothetical protein
MDRKNQTALGFDQPLMGIASSIQQEGLPYFKVGIAS